nr:MAG TPA: hypothetical protein [Caudoviricetes sp.]
MFPRRTGNCSQRVSYGNDSQCPHAGLETGGEKFPMVMIHNALMPDKKPFSKGFLL